jgi:hypothetical protein
MMLIISSILNILCFLNSGIIYLVLDKVVCPFLVKYFEMPIPIWHPTDDKGLDAWLEAEIEM